MNASGFHGRRSLSGWLERPLRKIQKKRGFAEGRILSDWKQIVGPALSQHSCPQKLSFPNGQDGATLTILCEPGWATELQFHEPLLLEKIACFFGYRAVARIRIRQGPLAHDKQAKRTLPKLDIAPESLPASDAMSAVADESIKAALERLRLSRARQQQLVNSAENDDIHTI